MQTTPLLSYRTMPTIIVGSSPKDYAPGFTLWIKNVGMIPVKDIEVTVAYPKIKFTAGTTSALDELNSSLKSTQSGNSTAKLNFLNPQEGIEVNFELFGIPESEFLKYWTTDMHLVTVRSEGAYTGRVITQQLDLSQPR
jgi:hypothetical protein